MFLEFEEMQSPRACARNCHASQKDLQRQAYITTFWREPFPYLYDIFRRRGRVYWDQRLVREQDDIVEQEMIRHPRFGRSKERDPVRRRGVCCHIFF